MASYCDYMHMRTEPNLAKGGSPVQSQTQRKASTDQALAVATKEYMKANNIPQAGHQASGGGLMVPTGYAQKSNHYLTQRNPFLFRLSFFKKSEVLFLSSLDFKRRNK